MNNFHSPPELESELLKFWKSQGPNGFEELKKYMRWGNEFCKDLASILTERAEHELNYSKGLNRTSARLQKLAKDFHGTLSEAWLQVAIQFDAESDAHKSLAGALQEEIVKPLKILADNQIKCRKPVSFSFSFYHFNILFCCLLNEKFYIISFLRSS